MNRSQFKKIQLWHYRIFRRKKREPRNLKKLQGRRQMRWRRLLLRKSFRRRLKERREKRKKKRGSSKRL